MYRTATALTALALLALSSAAVAQTIYRSVGPDGRVTYTDQPPAPGTDARRIEMQAQPPQGASPSGGLRPEERRQAESFVQRGREQAAALDRARAEAAAAQNDLANARKRLQEGAEPLPGERVGTSGGSSRLADAYFERQSQLERAVKEAEDRLQRAQRQVNELR